jgi:hypothetical protein
MNTPGTDANVECFNEETKAFSKETENMTKNQLEILELKKAITKIKNSDRLNAD